MRKLLLAFTVGTVGTLSSQVALAQQAPMIPVLAIERDQPKSDNPLASAVSGLNKMATYASSEASTSPVSNPPGVTCPADLAGLTDGFKQFTYSLNRSAAASLNIYGAASLNASDRVVLYQFMFYKDIVDGSGKSVARCGAGISLALKVSNFEGKFSTSLPFLAATAQLQQAEVAYDLGTFGMSGAGVNAAIPTASRVGTFNADAYAALLQAIDGIQKAAATNMPPVVVTPRLVAIASDSPLIGFSRQISIQAMALAQISRGKKCSQAKTEITSRDGATDALIDELYTNAVGRKACTDDVQPSDANRKEAADLLAASHLKWN
jgi:hypothetical protein